MSHTSRKFDPLTIAFWQGSCVLLVILRFYCCKLINHRKVRICLMLAKHSSNTVSIFFFPTLTVWTWSRCWTWRGNWQLPLSQSQAAVSKMLSSRLPRWGGSVGMHVHEYWLYCNKTIDQWLQKPQKMTLCLVNTIYMYIIIIHSLWCCMYVLWVWYVISLFVFVSV